MIVLAGASASGKTEVAKMLAKKYGIVKAITTTTRDLRVGEKDGRDYFFVSKDKFLEMIHDGRFVEYTTYNDHLYGSTKDQIAENKCVVVDPMGLKAYIDLHDDNILTFFLESTEDTRIKRMIVRGDKEEKIKSRILHDREAFKKENIPSVDCTIESEYETVEEVADEIYRIYQEFLSKR
ncbi:MAG: AAA family ATPase [Bacilli bacterium]|nr:AAA family ATPase [Bacilli bacterium]